MVVTQNMLVWTVYTCIRWVHVYLQSSTIILPQLLVHDVHLHQREAAESQQNLHWGFVRSPHVVPASFWSGSEQKRILVCHQEVIKMHLWSNYESDDARKKERKGEGWTTELKSGEGNAWNTALFWSHTHAQTLWLVMCLICDQNKDLLFQSGGHMFLIQTSLQHAVLFPYRHCGFT